MPFLVWAALLTSHGSYAFIIFTIMRPSHDHLIDAKILSLFAVVAVSISMLSEYFHRRSKSSKSQELTFKNHLISWALTEAISILGVILCVLYGENASLYSYSFIAIGFITLLMKKPET